MIICCSSVKGSFIGKHKLYLS